MPTKTLRITTRKSPCGEGFYINNYWLKIIKSNNLKLKVLTHGIVLN